MDIKERLARLEERRGETTETALRRKAQESGITLNDLVLNYAEALATASDDEVEEIIDLTGGLENYLPYMHMNDQPYFFTGLEAFSDRVVSIFDRIIAFIKRWIKVLSDADFRLSINTAMHHTTLENIRTEMRSSSRPHKTSPTFPVLTRIDGISVNFRPITKSATLLNALTILRNVADLYFTQHDSSILRQVNQVVAAVNGNAGYARVAAIMDEVSPKRLATNSIMKLDSDMAISPHLLGNHRFVITRETTSSDRADQIHGTRIRMERSQSTNTNTADAVRFEYFDTSMAEALLTKCDSILAILSESNNGPRRHGRRQGMQSLLSCIERVRAGAGSGAISEEESSKTIALLESYTAWIADPYTSLYSYMLRTVKATLNLVVANNA